MISTLQLGNNQFPNNIIQGPLAGYSSAPFRFLTWVHSKPAFTCTEMISSKALINQPKRSLDRYVKKMVGEGPVCFQLSGNSPKELGEAAKIVTDYGADLIDLNCGCPVKKIRRKGMGSSLLETPSDLFQLITALKNNTSVPVSIKIRVEGNKDQTNQQIAQVVQDAGADFLIVHGRHWTDNYDIACRYEQIAYFVQELKIPVIGNGDIACLSSLQRMFATNCAGVMISRAGVGQPWLIAQLAAMMRGDGFTVPAVETIGGLFLQHVYELSKLFDDEKFAVIQARKLVKYYGRGITSKTNLVNAVNSCDSLSGIEKIVQQYFI